MPGAEWFPGSELNFAEHLLRHSEGTALIELNDAGQRQELSFDQLRHEVAKVRTGLAELGVQAGDRVAAYVTNTPEAVIAFLATASIGAIWSSCPPEFGVPSVVDRFGQISPKVLIAVDGYSYAGRWHDRRDAVEKIHAALPDDPMLIRIRSDGIASDSSSELGQYGEKKGQATAACPQVTHSFGHREMSWESLTERAEPLRFNPVSFAHPLWVLYSSGTTGMPKAIVHGHGGMLLEHFKVLSLHSDLGPEDRFFWYSTTGWMMWNYLVSGLMVGATVILYQGSPAHPDLSALWAMAAQERVSYFGTSAPFLMSCRENNLDLSPFDLSAITRIGSTGAPLPPEGFEWVYEQMGASVQLGSVSGGTDLCTAFVASCPWLPVRAGELQCAALGASVQALSEAGEPLIGSVGELALSQPMPCMPVGFWNDPNGARLSSSYFGKYPGVWHHGDWIRMFEDGAAVIYGRSDSTLNRGGVRMGTSDFYRVVQEFPDISDSLVVDTSELGQQGRLWLFIVTATPEEDQANFQARLRGHLREQLSPRHAPDVLVFVPEVPYTLSGKKLEVPVKRLLQGKPLSEVANPGTLKNPSALSELAARADAAQVALKQ